MKGLINIFATIISDAYKSDEREEIANALNDLCDSRDAYGWSSTGIYSFWDYYTKEIFYIGLAVDLEERFKQHNGLLPIDTNSCKREKIEEYFSTKEKIGFSIFVQSPLSQPITSKNQGVWRNIHDEDFDVIDLRSSKARDDVKLVEGILIEAYRFKHGTLPPWNIVGGSLNGQQRAVPGNYQIVESFSQQTPLVAHSTLREISLNPTLERYENYLFTARFFMIFSGMAWGDAMEFAERFDSMGTFQEMRDNGYLKKKLIL